MIVTDMENKYHTVSYPKLSQLEVKESVRCLSTKPLDPQKVAVTFRSLTASLGSLISLIFISSMDDEKSFRRDTLQLCNVSYQVAKVYTL